MNTVLVLGHSGFIGGYLTNYLKKRGHEVIGASSLECDLLDSVSTARFLVGLPSCVDVVFSSGNLRSAQDSYETMIENISMVCNFITEVPKSKLNSLVFLSSTSLYGRNPLVPINELSSTDPCNFYDISKIANESLLKMPGILDCPVTILRLPGIYGQGDRGESLIGRLFSRMRDTNSVMVYGEGETKRDLVSVNDVGSTVEGILEKPLNGLLNVATGSSYTILKIIEMIAEVSGLSPKIIYSPPDLSSPNNLVFDTVRLLDWLPELQFTNLEDGIGRYVVGGNN